MKKQIVKQFRVVFLLTICLLFGSSAGHLSIPPGKTPAATKSAVISNPYTVQNNLACSVDIIYQIYLFNGACSSCSTSMPITILPGGNISIPIPAACLPACNMEISLVDVGGTAVSLSVDIGNPTNSGSGGGPPCSNYNMSWSNSQTDIN
jgi:hypothetical protein